MKRAIDLLRAVARSDRPRTLAELAQATDLSKATAYRLLQTLASEGLVTFSPEKTSYSPGGQLLEIALSCGKYSLISAMTDLERISNPEMRQLSADSGETVALVVRRGDFRINVAVVLGTYELISMPKVGAQHPVHLGGPGKLILSSFSVEQFGGYARRSAKAGAPFELTEAVEEELRRIRATGYATSLGEAVPGQASISTPIQKRGRLVAALNLIVPTVRFDRDRLDSLVPLVKRAAESISAMMDETWDYDTATWE